MAPGRKRKQLLAALHHMRRDVMANRRPPVRTQLRSSSQPYGVVMRCPAARLGLRSPQAPPTSVRHDMAAGRRDVLSFSAQQPSPGATDF
eukprot:3216668-Rhodomonas_salina.1